MRHSRRQALKMIAVLALGAAVLLPGAGWAQLDATCMVSAFNRTAPVGADGVWVLPNVPAGLGKVRVRATCVADGAVRFGGSGLIDIPPLGVIKVGDINFELPPPIPTGLTLSAPSTPLTSVGQTVQLTVMATFADGTTAEVTAANHGTDYKSSNPAIATVDAGGLVTARASGVAILSAVSEGALAAARVQVVLSGSTAGDGIPDDWKLAHGIDPNDPLAALEDLDHDGLTNREEFQAGTDPRNPDSDGDGLQDGDEVHLYRTDPLQSDTDGDGLWDGLEVRTGSDPLDPGSFNLALALQSIEASPSSVALVFNAVVGEASRLLQVTGHLTDGHTLDLAKPLYGTRFSSSDLTVANFGPQPARIYAGRDGTATVTAGNSGFSAAVSVAVRAFAPTELSFLPIPGFPNDVTVAGNYAYVAAGLTGLFIVEVSDLLRPVIAGSFDTPGNANGVKVSGDVAFVADQGEVLAIDVHAPAHPALLGRLPASFAVSLAVRDGRVYVADRDFGLRILDAHDPAHLTELGTLDLPGSPQDVAVEDNLAVVACGEGGLAIVDVSDPSAPVLVGATATRPDGTSSAAGVAVRDRMAYVADGADTLGGLRVVDFHDAAHPVVVGATDDRYGLTRVALDDGFALAADYYFINAVPIFDIATSLPSYRAQIDFSLGRRDDNGFGIAARDGVVFMAGAQYIYRPGTAGNGGLFIGAYRLAQDSEHLVPKVAITAPVAGATVKANDRLILTADATDDLSVESVTFSINGVPLGSSFRRPFALSFPFTVPNDRSTSLSVGAVATNLTGFQATATPVVVNIVPNPAPVASLLAPVPGQTFPEGAPLVLAAQGLSSSAITRVDLFIDAFRAASLATPPYTFTYPDEIPPGTYAATAVAYDAVGPSSPSAPVTFTIVPDNPIAAVVSPVDGARVVEGTQYKILAGASDHRGVRSVSALANGSSLGTLSVPPFEFSTTAPPAGEATHLSVTVVNARGGSTTSPEVVIQSVPDPLTTVTGQVVDPLGAPLAGATVVVSTAAGSASPLGTTDADGLFSVAGVRTNEGGLSIGATGTVNGCPAQGSVGAAVPPVPGGVTAVGSFTLDSGPVGPPPPPPPV